MKHLPTKIGKCNSKKITSIAVFRDAKSFLKIANNQIPQEPLIIHSIETTKESVLDVADKVFGPEYFFVVTNIETTPGGYLSYENAFLKIIVSK